MHCFVLSFMQRCCCRNAWISQESIRGFVCLDVVCVLSSSSLLLLLSVFFFSRSFIMRRNNKRVRYSFSGIYNTDMCTASFEMAALKKMQRIKTQLKVAKKNPKMKWNIHQVIVSASQVSSIENSNIPHVLSESERKRKRIENRISTLEWLMCLCDL